MTWRVPIKLLLGIVVCWNISTLKHMDKIECELDRVNLINLIHYIVTFLTY